MTKRKPTAKEWDKIRALYLKGEKPRFIVEKFPELDLNAKAISTKFSANKTTAKRDKIKDKVEQKLLSEIQQEQENANRELIKISKKIVSVVAQYLENENYKDFAGFTKRGFFCETSETINTRGLREVVKALADAQAIQRLALDMDNKDEAENITPPTISINLGDFKNESEPDLQ